MKRVVFSLLFFLLLLYGGIASAAERYDVLSSDVNAYYYWDTITLHNPLNDQGTLNKNIINVWIKADLTPAGKLDELQYRQKHGMNTVGFDRVTSASILYQISVDTMSYKVLQITYHDKSGNTFDKILNSGNFRAIRPFSTADMLYRVVTKQASPMLASGRWRTIGETSNYTIHIDTLTLSFVEFESDPFVDCWVISKNKSQSPSLLTRFIIRVNSKKYQEIESSAYDPDGYLIRHTPRNFNKPWNDFSDPEVAVIMNSVIKYVLENK